MTDKEYDEMKARMHKANVLRQRIGIAKENVRVYTHMEGVFADHDGRRDNATKQIKKWITILKELNSQFKQL